MTDQSEWRAPLMVLTEARAAVSAKLEELLALSAEPGNAAESASRVIDHAFADEYLPLQATEDEARAAFRALFDSGS